MLLAANKADLLMKLAPDWVCLPPLVLVNAVLECREEHPLLGCAKGLHGA